MAFFRGKEATALWFAYTGLGHCTIIPGLALESGWWDYLSPGHTFLPLDQPVLPLWLNLSFEEQFSAPFFFFLGVGKRQNVPKGLLGRFRDFLIQSGFAFCELLSYWYSSPCTHSARQSEVGPSSPLPLLLASKPSTEQPCYPSLLGTQHPTTSPLEGSAPSQQVKPSLHSWSFIPPTLDQKY